MEKKKKSNKKRNIIIISVLVLVVVGYSLKFIFSSGSNTYSSILLNPLFIV